MRRASDDDRHGRGHLTDSLGDPAPAQAPGEAGPGRRRIRTAAAVSVVAVALGVAGYALRPTSDPRQEGGVAELDEPFPGLVGEAVVGPPIDTATMDGAVRVVNVWATWCEPCRREQPALLEVQAAFEGSGVEFVGVDYRDDRAAATRWIDDFGVEYPSLFDPQGRTAASLGFPFLPDTYLVDANGTMRYAIYGETSAEELSGLIDELLAGTP
jgi:cytochrome c biogenesis protein CcmG/thiol:disulfide interchange protein DsbE